MVKIATPRMKRRRPAEQVREPASEQEDASEEDRVGGDHPLEAFLAEVEVGLDRRERDVHDRDVEDDHELRDDDDCQSDPSSTIFQWAHRLLQSLSASTIYTSHHGRALH
jgi:hypothetical protein